MSNRRRVRRAPQSYSARLQRRSPARSPRPGPGIRRLQWTVWWLPAALAVIAEAGHLAAAYVEWPEATGRGIYQVAAGALLGLVAVTVSMSARRLLLVLGTVVAIAGPVVWLGGTLIDASPYHLLPAPVAIGITVSEAALAALLFARTSTTRPKPAGSSTVQRTGAEASLRR